MDLQEVGGGCADWMELAQDRENGRIFSTGQSPQWAVVSMEEEEKKKNVHVVEETDTYS